MGPRLFRGRRPPLLSVQLGIGLGSVLSGLCRRLQLHAVAVSPDPPTRIPLCLHLPPQVNRSYEPRQDSVCAATAEDKEFLMNLRQLVTDWLAGIRTQQGQ